MDFLDAGRHNLCKDAEGNIIFGSDGSLIVEDTRNKTAMSIPLTQEVLDFFGLQFQVEENSGTSSASNQAATQSAQVAVWENSDEKILIEMWKKYIKVTNIEYKSADVWQFIRTDVNTEASTAYTLNQVENKRRNLRKKYMFYVDSTGSKNSDEEPLKKPKHYEALDEIFRKTPQVEPVAIASSRRSSNTDAFAESPSSPHTSILDDETDSARKPSKCKKLSKVQKGLSTWGEKMQVDSPQKEEVRADRFNTLLGVYDRIAQAQEAVATSVGQLTQFIMARGHQGNAP